MKFGTAMTRALCAGVLVAVCGVCTAQQAYPSKPLRLILPYAPGGSTSNIARLMGQKMTEGFGQQVIVDNRPGGDTIIGAEALAKSPPDGYTIMVMASTHVTIPLLHKNVPFDAIKDFTPVATLVGTEQLLVLHPLVPANTLQEFIALAKLKSGQLNYSSAGRGSATHLAMELFNIMAGVKVEHIPYKGGGPAVTDLIGGQVQASIQPPISVIAHIKSGRLKSLAISGGARLPALPQVPTFAEGGLPGFEVKFWLGVLGPAGLPRAVTERLVAEFARILALPEIKEKLQGQGMEPFISSPAQFAALMKADMAKAARIIKTANIRLDQ